MSNKKKKNSASKKTNKKQAEKTQYKLTGKLGVFFEQHILFWLLIFPPVAIYKMVKHKIIGKPIAIIVALCFVLVLAYCILISISPNYIENVQLESKLTEDGYGMVRDVEYIGVYKDLHMSEVITTTGLYTVYYDYSDNGNLFLNTVMKLETLMVDDTVQGQFVAVHTSDKTNPLLTEINPAAIKFIITNDAYGDIEEVITSDYNSQVFKTTKGEYKFHYRYYQTYKIQKFGENNIWEDVMNRKAEFEMKEDFQRVLNKKTSIAAYYQISNIKQFGITETEIYYVFSNFCGNEYRIVRYNDNSYRLEIGLNNAVAQEDLAAAWEAYQDRINDPEYGVDEDTDGVEGTDSTETTETIEPTESQENTNPTETTSSEEVEAYAA